MSLRRCVYLRVLISLCGGVCVPVCVHTCLFACVCLRVCMYQESVFVAFGVSPVGTWDDDPSTPCHRQPTTKPPIPLDRYGSAAIGLTRFATGHASTSSKPTAARGLYPLTLYWIVFSMRDKSFKGA